MYFCFRMMRLKQLVWIGVLFCLGSLIFVYVTENFGSQGEKKTEITEAKNNYNMANPGMNTIHKPNNIIIEKKDETTDSNSKDEELVSVAKKISGYNRTVYVTMVNDAYLPFTYSWLCNTKDMGIHKSVLIITTDTVSKVNLTRDWPEISVVELDIKGNVQGDQVYSHVGYVKIMIRRTEMLLAILEADIEIFLFEVDCLWFANPVPEFQQLKGFDILVNPVAERTGTYAGGFLYLYATEKAKYLWKRVTFEMLTLGERISKLDDKASISEGENDQVFLSSLVVKRYGNITIKELPLDIYADGKWYELTEEKRKQSHPVIVNNNWVLGNPAKIARAKKWKHWFIREDWTCDMDLVHKTVY